MSVVLGKRMTSFPAPILFTLTHNYLVILAGWIFIHEKSVVCQFRENVVERFSSYPYAHSSQRECHILKNPEYYLHNVITVTSQDLLAFHNEIWGQGLERLIEFSYGDNLHWHPTILNEIKIN